mmetsp:Transcript_26838/g.56677  ORF Transcript_26838/g.56677 Transcript_26838/m.56677 type:complete len:534 (+) Transcript_26838:64-1665(+)
MSSSSSSIASPSPSTMKTTPPSNSNNSSVVSSEQKRTGATKMTQSTSAAPSSTSSLLLPRILSGSIGSIVTALTVTPLEVVKIRQQAAGALHSPTTTRTRIPTTNYYSVGGSGGSGSGAGGSGLPITSFRGIKVEPCRGCGTLVLNNGLMECVLPIESTPLRSSSCGGVATAGTAPTSTSATATPAAAAQQQPIQISRAKVGGTFSTLLSIFRHEGSAGLYAGLRPTLVMSVPNTVLYFTAYDELSSLLRNNNNNNNHATMMFGSNNSNNRRSQQADSDDGRTSHQAFYIPLIAGSSARLLASLATAPLELIRTRQASAAAAATTTNTFKASSANVPGMMEEFRHLIQTRGPSSLYVGLSPTLWRDVPFSAIYWLFLERFKGLLVESHHHNNNNNNGEWKAITPAREAFYAFVSGAAAGSIAAAFTTPFDVVKTRRQMVIGQQQQQTATNKPSSLAMETIACDHFGLKEYPKQKQQPQQQPLGTFGHMQQILRQEGIAGLWKGNVTRMVKVAPACAIMISCYEFGKLMFGEVL